MKCLLITSYFPPVIGGSATVYGNIHKYGQPHVFVLTARRDRETGAPIKRSGDDHTILETEYIQPPAKRSRSLLQSALILLTNDLPVHIKLACRCIRIIRKMNIGVVCLGEIQALGWLGSLLKLFSKAKVVYYAHGEELTTRQTSRFIGRQTEKHLRQADGIICVSSYTRSVLANQYNILSHKLKLITNGIDINKPRAQTSPTINNKGIVLFSAGRLIDRKGFDFAIKAMRLVLPRHPDTSLLIAGDGPNIQKYSKLISELNLQSNVTLLGRVSDDELTTLYQQCDIFIMPNRELDNGDTEGFGLVFLEANLFKKPVIGGRAGGASDAIVHKKTGLLVDSTTPKAIAEAIERLIEDKKLRQDLGTNGYRWALENNVKNKVNAFIAYCNTLCEETNNNA